MRRAKRGWTSNAISGGRERDGSGLEETVVRVNRVAKVVKGGKRFSFSALVVVGDRKGKVGFAIGKAGEVPEAIRKAVEQARKSLSPCRWSSGRFRTRCVTKSAPRRVLLKPAAPGTGVIAGGSMRAVLELAGIHDILTKSLGTNNPINVVMATVDRPLKSLRTAASKSRRCAARPSREIYAGAKTRMANEDTIPQDSARSNPHPAAGRSASASVAVTVRAW